MAFEKGQNKLKNEESASEFRFLGKAENKNQICIRSSISRPNSPGP